MKTFEVHIELGNDAMQSTDDVAAALRRIALVLEQQPRFDNCRQYVMDCNGNRVGLYGTGYQKDTKKTRGYRVTIDGTD